MAMALLCIIYVYTTTFRASQRLLSLQSTSTLSSPLSSSSIIENDHPAVLAVPHGRYSLDNVITNLPKSWKVAIVHHNHTTSMVLPLLSGDTLVQARETMTTTNVDQTTATTLAHLQAIQDIVVLDRTNAVQEQTQEMDSQLILVILQDDIFNRTQIHSSVLWNSIEAVVETAPLGWDILQLVTDNIIVNRHMSQLVHNGDYWISWQPEHTSAMAYILSIKGMEQVLSNNALLLELLLHDTNSTTTTPMQSSWNGTNLSTEQIIYGSVSHAYTSTVFSPQFPWTSMQPPTVSKTHHHTENTATALFPTIHNHHHHHHHHRQRSESILVIMSLRVKTVKEISQELNQIQQDYHSLCSIHHPDGCHWKVNVVLVNPTLHDEWIHHPIYRHLEDKTQTSKSHLHFHFQVTAERFNKFTFVAMFIDQMAQYDLILLKDNDQWISGLPWNTFLKKMGTSLVAGPLRQNSDDYGMTTETATTTAPPVTYPFHHGSTWKHKSSSLLSSWYATITPLQQVPFIEMYFVVLTGDFAQWFFDQVLTDTFIRQPVAWGPDFQWCAAAKDYRPDLPSCRLIPVISVHKDTQQIVKKDGFEKMGMAALDHFRRQNKTFGRWIASGRDKWNKIIKDHTWKEIKKQCRQMFAMKLFDLQECAIKAAIP